MALLAPAAHADARVLTRLISHRPSDEDGHLVGHQPRSGGLLAMNGQQVPLPAVRGQQDPDSCS